MTMITSYLYRSVAFAAFLLYFTFTVHANSAYTGMRENFSSLDITCDMGAGINLYNTLDAACNYETGLNTEKCWGQPFTTLDMITDMKNRGFSTLRIPVTWYLHMGTGPDYAIDEEWMDRVEEVANYAFENDMYVIINIHHDDLKSNRPGSWLFPSYATRDANIAQLEKVWTQIANRFKEYGDYLIFETLNEPRPTETPNEWNGGTSEHREVVNDYNQASVNAIRATGGNNASRFIMVPQIAAQLGAAVNDLSIPNNDPKTIVSVHHYSPFPFALGGEQNTEWGTPQEIQNLDNDIKSLYDTFVSKGIGVVMGEWGAGNKDNLAQRVNYYDIYAGIMKKYQVTPVVWIFNYNRKTGVWGTPELENAILQYYGQSCESGAPLVSITNIGNGQSFGPGSSLQVNVTALDADGSITYVELYLDGVLISRQSKAPYVWNASGQLEVLNDLVTGTYELEAIAVDNESNTSSTSITFEIEPTLTIPGVIEAEDFFAQSGIHTEATADVGGGENIGFIQSGDWTEYAVFVQTTANYRATFRIATATNGGTIQASLDETVVGEALVNSTDGWQTWEDVEIEVVLSEGFHTLRFDFVGGDGFLFNLNYARMDVLTEVNELSSEGISRVYPNPVQKMLHLAHHDGSMWQMLDMQGRLLLEGSQSTIPTHHLSPGVYFIRFREGSISRFDKQ